MYYTVSIVVSLQDSDSSNLGELLHLQYTEGTGGNEDISKTERGYVPCYSTSEYLYTLIRTHATYTRTHTHTCMYTHPHTPTHACNPHTHTHACTRTHTHPRTHATHTHTCMYTHPHTCAHTHTHTRTHSYHALYSTDQQ